MANANALRQDLLRRTERTFAEATRLMVDELREAAPLGETGETRRGISAELTGAGTQLSATIVSVGKGGQFVEEGTRPHLIVARGKALRFLGGGERISQPGPNQRIATRSGGVVFAKSVNHPGTPARPWFKPVVDRWTEFLQRAQAFVR